MARFDLDSGRCVGAVRWLDILILSMAALGCQGAEAPKAPPGSTVAPGSAGAPGSAVAPGSTVAPGSAGAPGSTVAPGSAVAPGSESTATPSAAASPPCTRAVARKLGIPFVRVCPQDLGRSGVDFEPFWIAAAPVGCSAGEHETVRCPRILALSSAETQFVARTASVIAPVTAHQVCAMRLNGRLPTRAERVRARAALGLSTAVIAYGPESSRLSVDELPEWVTENPCSQPTVLPAECGIGVFPSGASPAVVETDTLSCVATAGTPGQPAIELGERCAADDWLATAKLSPRPTLLPCALRGSRTLEPALYSVACEAPTVARRPPLAESLVAGFRCVLPDLALAPGAAD